VTSALTQDARSTGAPPGPAITACEGQRAPLVPALLYELRSGAFPSSGAPDVAVHVPPGFDATRRPGVVLYFHGWNGCVAASLADDDMPCTPGGEPRPGSRLAAQLDDAGVNAILVAVELRVDSPTGEPGQLAAPGDVRQLLRELFTEHLDAALGCALEVEVLDRVIVVAHSGGYQAAASALAFGELPNVTEVVLLDALYGAEGVFGSWLTDALEGDGTRRFVDLYTCCGGTLERSRSLAGRTSEVWPPSTVFDSDDDARAVTHELTHPVVLARVADLHVDLPRAYFRPILEAAGFARLRRPD